MVVYCNPMLAKQKRETESQHYSFSSHVSHIFENNTTIPVMNMPDKEPLPLEMQELIRENKELKEENHKLKKKNKKLKAKIETMKFDLERMEDEYNF